MSAKLYEHLSKTSSPDLLVLLKFFDHPNLRQYYTGLIADIRKELTERGVELP